MFNNVEWLFFDVGSTIVDESLAYKHRLEDIAAAANVPYEDVYSTALEFYKRNTKGDKETAKHFGVPLTAWHIEDEFLYADAARSLERLHRNYKIGIIANQVLGTAERLENFGILQHIDLVIASAEEGVAKPDQKIFEIALQKANCQPGNAVMIGDRVDNDIVPAKLLGMGTIWVKQGFGQYWKVSCEAEKADLTVNNLSAVCDIL